MNKIAESNLNLKGNQELYIPLEDFHKQATNIKDNYYQSEFSFQPVFEKLKELKRNQDTGFPKVSKLFKEFEKELLTISKLNGTQDQSGKVEMLIRMLFPALFFEGQLGFVSTPFTKTFTFMTPGMIDMFTAGEWELKMKSSMMNPKAVQTVLQAGSCILEKHYNGQRGMEFTETMSVRHKKTKLEKHYKINIITDFIKATPLKTS